MYIHLLYTLPTKFHPFLALWASGPFKQVEQLHFHMHDQAHYCQNGQPDEELECVVFRYTGASGQRFMLGPPYEVLLRFLMALGTGFRQPGS